MEEKRPSFVESSDSDIRKLVSNVVSEITKKSTKYGTRKLKSAKGFLGHCKSSFHITTCQVLVTIFKSRYNNRAH